MTSTFGSGQYVFDLSAATGGSCYVFGGEVGVGGTANAGGYAVVDNSYFTMTNMQLSSGYLQVGSSGGAGHVVLLNCHCTTTNAFNITTGGKMVIIGGQFSNAGTINNAGLLTLSGISDFAWTVAGTAGTVGWDSLSNFASGTMTLSGGTALVPAFGMSTSAGLGNYGWGTFTATATTITPQAGYPSVVAQSAAAGSTSTQTLTYAGVAAASTYRVTFRIRVTVAGTSTIPALTYNNQGNTNTGPTAAAVWKFDGISVAPIYSIVGNGEYQAEVVFGCGSTGPGITMTITPTGSTFTWTMTVERLGP
jgi:hypothetical protein